MPLFYFSFNGMLNFYSREQVHFKSCFRPCGPQFLGNHIRQDFAAFPHDNRLFLRVVGRLDKLGNHTGQLPHFGERLDDGDGGGGRFFAFQNGGEHVEAFFGKGCR